MENIYLYYDFTPVSIVANTHFIDLLLNIPLKSANSYFTLFKVINFPTHVFSDKFSQYFIDYSYFGLQNSQRAYLRLTETDYVHCEKGSITICPANTPVYNTQTVTCLSSLFFPEYKFSPRLPTKTASSAPNSFSSTSRKNKDFSLSIETPDFTAMPQHHRPYAPHDNTLQSQHLSHYF